MTKASEPTSTQLAYGLLCAALLLLGALLQSKQAILQELDQNNARLLQDIEQAQHRDSKQNARILEMETQIDDLTSHGHMVASDFPAETAQRLQQAAKNALSAGNGTLLQMQPEQNQVNETLWSHSLQASFNLLPQNLDDWLYKASLEYPTPLIESLSLRKNVLPDRTVLDGIANLRVYSLAGGKNTSASQVVLDKIKLRATERSQLGGLFNPLIRSRDIAGSLKHYRISAISLSEHARAVLLVDSLTGETKRVEKGGLLNGWTLNHIESKSIDFIKNDDSQTLQLYP